MSNNCDIAPDAADSYYGFDVLDVAVIPPTEAGDLMSYAVNVGKPRWPSDYTYRALESSLAGSLADPAPQATDLTQKVLEAAETLAVTGVISPTEGTASFNYAYRLSEGMVSTGKLSRLTARIRTNGNYSLRLLDENEQILVEQTFSLPDEGDPFGDTRAFNMLLPYDPASAFLVLTSDSTELARRPISPAAPTVQVIAPNGGENIAGAMTVEWQAADADDDDLLYTVQYSADGGTRWQTVVADYYTSTLTLDDLSTLPGSDTALIRIIATDGVNTTADASDATFQVAPNPPEAHISSPADGAAFVQGTQVVLIGVASDPEDGSLSGEDLTWSVDGAPAGSGQEMTLTDLAPGSYEVTLTATDSSDAQGSDTITLLVVEDASQGASIQIRKQATDNSTVFNFTLDGQPFSLKNGELFLVDELDSGSHTVVETVPAGWELLSIRCDNGQTLSNPDSSEVTIDLETDEDVVCTFTNSGPTATIYLPVVIK